MKEINWKNDPLLHSEKYRYVIKQRYVNYYRGLILIDDFKNYRWMVRTPYLVSPEVVRKILKIFDDLGGFDNVLIELIERIEAYSRYKYVKRNVAIRMLKKQFRRNMLNVVVLRCISLLIEQYTDRSSIDFMLECLKKAKYYRGCFRDYNLFKPPLTLSRVLSNSSVYLVGVVMGDGHICRNDAQIEISDGHQNEKLLKLSKIYLQKLRKLIFDNYGTKSYIKLRGKRMYFLNITSKWYGTYLHNLFDIPIGKKAEKICVPNILFLLPKKTLLEKLTFFWRGMFDTDGSINQNMSNFQISLASKSTNIMKSLGEFLSNPFIKISYTKRKEKGIHKIYIGILDYLKFARKVGSYHPLRIHILVQHLMKGPTFKKKKKWRKLSAKELSILMCKWENLRTPHLF